MKKNPFKIEKRKHNMEYDEKKRKSAHTQHKLVC